MIDDELVAEFSPLTGVYAKDGEKFEVRIFPRTGGNGEWALQVVIDGVGATMWDETFPTDAGALHEFQLTATSDGIGSFRKAPAKALH